MSDVIIVFFLDVKSKPNKTKYQGAADGILYRKYAQSKFFVPRFEKKNPAYLNNCFSGAKE